MQITPSQARQRPWSSRTVPSPASVAGSPATGYGQTRTHSPQKVQPAAEKSSQGNPASACPSGCIRTIPGPHAVTQGW